MDTPISIDLRIYNLSYSSRTVLHRCPRKFQLQKIAKQDREYGKSVTFEFGTVVGIGVQSHLQGKSFDAVVFDMFMAWELPDLYDEETSNKKSFFTAVFAVQSFISLASGILGEYELAYFKGKPAVELSFRISMMDKFKYRGYVDVVMKHKTTGKFIVLEVKTTGAKYVDEATYKNSSQALGYSIVLDTIAPHSSEYEVWYLVYLSSVQRWELLPFRKHYSDRAFWIKELVMDVERIQYYESQGRYPSYGESCNDFFKRCEFYDTCQMSTALLSLPYDAETMQDTTEYLLELSLLDLINAQLNRQEIQV